MGGQWQFEANAKSGAREGCCCRFATLLGFRIHPCEFDFAQDRVHLHRAFKEALCGIIARALFHLGDDVEVHAARKGVFARGDYDAFDGFVGMGLIDKIREMRQSFEAQHVHGFVGNVPRDYGNAVGVCGHGEIGHGLTSLRRVR